MELLLAVTSTIHVLPIPGMFLSFPFSFFMVLRILRLIKASPMLEAFVYKVTLQAYNINRTCPFNLGCNILTK